MQPFKNYEEAKKQAQNRGSKQLPVGAYICKILGVRYEVNEEYSDRIILQFDVSEGEYKDFFKKRYESDTNEDKKWKGVARIYVPNDDGSEKDSWTQNKFASWINDFEKSNSGYIWDWDENKFKGKSIGIVFGEIGNVINGKEVKYTEARWSCSTDDVKKDSYYRANFHAKNGYTGTQNSSDISVNSSGFLEIPEGIDEEIPF